MLKNHLVGAVCATGILAIGAPASANAGSITAVPGCVVGHWQSTGLPEHPNDGFAAMNLTGGSGVEVTIGPDGHTEVNFANMSPVAFTVRLGDARFSGRFQYTGAATGTMATTFTTDGPLPSPGATGRWRPVGDVARTTHVALELDRPTDVGTNDNMPLAGYPHDAVDKDPFFDAGRYWCMGDILITAPDDGGLPMILSRTEPWPAR